MNPLRRAHLRAKLAEYRAVLDCIDTDLRLDEPEYEYRLHIHNDYVFAEMLVQGDDQHFMFAHHRGRGVV
jgi:hypothetical protein